MSYFEDVLADIKQKQAQENASTRAKMLEDTNPPKTAEVRKPQFRTPEPRRPEMSVTRTETQDRLTSQASVHNKLNYKDAIFRVYAPVKEGTSIGSGFFHTAEGEFVTDLHVVENNKTCKILLNNGQLVTGVIDARDSKTDLAAGHVVDAKFKLPHLILEESILADYAGTTYTAGYPGGGDFKVSTGKMRKVSAAGIVSAGEFVQGENPMRQVIVTNNLGRPGMSGGVLFNKDWLPIGVIDKGDKVDRGDSSETISTPIADCLKLIRQARSAQFDRRP